MKWEYYSPWRGVQYSDDPSDLLVRAVYDNIDNSDDYDEVEARFSNLPVQVESLSVGESQNFGLVSITRIE